VAESNINRQVQAVGATVGQAKVQALTDRIADIHPGCSVHGVEAFVDEGNWPQLLPQPVDVVIDACDQIAAKWAMVRWAMATHPRVPLVVVGAAGGKRWAHQVDVADLTAVTHDRLLASLRQRVRRNHPNPSFNESQGAKKPAPWGVCCVYSKEAVRSPSGTCDVANSSDGSLNCHGYGSSVVVTATFGMVAAQEALRLALQFK
jgi:tRNA A37 threonylcarbamoyladenosine dehydratase